MNEFLLRILGVPAAEAGSVIDARLEFLPVYGWGVVLALVLPALAVSVWSYRRRDVELTSGRRVSLLCLRCLAVLALGGVLLRPSLGLTVEGLVRQTLVLLFDQSASMALRDPRVDGPDRVRAAIARGTVTATGGVDREVPAPERGLTSASRLELLQAVLTNRELALVERLGRNFDLRPAGFSSDLTSLAAGFDTNAPEAGMARSGSLEVAALAAGLRADGTRSAPGTALRELLDRERGRPLGGVVVFTDGIRNAGTDPGAAAAVARDAGVPLHFVGLGTTAPRDVQVVEFASTEVCFVRDEMPVSVRLRVRGMGGQAQRVVLTVDGRKVDEREVTVEADGETVVPLRYTPEQVGDYELAVEVPPRADEILAENNRQSRRLRVIDDRIRVLFLEESPRWEFRYLQALLMRDRRVEVKCVLYDGDAAIARSPGSPYLDQFPSRREELFAYDLIVFGDVDPKHFTPAQLEVISEFVSRSGGSFLMLAGRRFSPWSYRDTALERLLPVEFDRVLPGTMTTAVFDRPIKTVLTDEGRASGFLKLADDPAENVRKWEALPPLYLVAPVRGAKPAAQVLLADATRDDPGQRTPVVALQQYGVGQSMFVGTDNTWRWRRNEGEQFYVAFWGRLVQRLAIHHLLTGSRRTQLVLDRTAAIPGETIALTGRLFTSAFEPLGETVVRARIDRESRDGDTNGPASASTELLLRAVPDQPGVFRGEIVAAAPGRYRVTVGEEAPASADFTVEDRLVEAGETAMQEASLREWAAATGGVFFREEDLHRLPEVALGKSQRVRSRMAVDLWSSPLYYLLVLSLLTAEWVLRKWWHLK